MVHEIFIDVYRNDSHAAIIGDDTALYDFKQISVLLVLSLMQFLLRMSASKV